MVFMERVTVEACANNRMNTTWLISALFESLTRIEVGWLAKVLTPHPPSTLCEPLGRGPILPCPYDGVFVRTPRMD
jgi:hypothetical protein